MFDAKVRHKLIPCFLIIADDDPLSLGDTIDVQSNAINMDESENVNTASICSEDSDADLDFDEGECKKSIWENFNSRMFRQGQAFYEFCVFFSIFGDNTEYFGISPHTRQNLFNIHKRGVGDCYGKWKLPKK